MSVEIKHRWNGKVLHTVEADNLSGANRRGNGLWVAESLDDIEAMEVAA